MNSTQNHKTGFVKMLAILFSFMLAAVFTSSNLWAQEDSDKAVVEETKEEAAAEVEAVTTNENTMAVGIGAGLGQTPEEADYKADGIPMEIYFDWDITKDWIKFRVGYNKTNAKVKWDDYGKSWTSEMATNSIYIAYRYAMELATDLDVFGMAGLAMMSSTISINNGGGDTSASALGYIWGGGAYYYFGSFGVGCQLVGLSGEVDFDDIGTTALGSTQLQLAANFNF